MPNGFGIGFGFRRWFTPMLGLFGVSFSLLSNEPRARAKHAKEPGSNTPPVDSGNRAKS
ncbi:MAG: hypothetical protein QMC90_03520 [Dehalococcoidales bacterium]|nr:hypothetical protein [Dehalococcoidales bacterium]